MAFKRGQPIQAGLGAANFSPILQGGQAMGNAYANVGSSLASAGMQAMQTYQMKKQQKAQQEAANMYLQQNMGMTPDMSQNLVKTLGPQNAMMFGQQQVANSQAQQAAIANGLATMKAWAETPINEETGTRDTGLLYANYQNNLPKGMAPNTALLDEMIDNSRQSSGVVVNVGDDKPTLEEAISTEEAKARSKARVDNLSAIEASGMDAEVVEAEAGRAIELLNEGARTGFAQGTEVVGKQVMEAFGVKTDVAGQEELNRLLGNQVMERIKQTKGAVSEREMKLFEQYSASPNKTPEGNLAIMKAVQRKAARDKELAKIVREGRYNDLSSKEIQKRVANYIESHPLFDENIVRAKDSYGELLKAQPNLLPANGETPSLPRPAVPVDNEANRNYLKLRERVKQQRG